MQVTRCDYFEWYDVPVAGRHGEVVTFLNNRRIFLEEKISLLEEKIVFLESKLGQEKEKTIASEIKNSKIMKVLVTCLIVCLAMFVIGFQKEESGSGWLKLM